MIPHAPWFTEARPGMVAAPVVEPFLKPGV